MKINEVNTRMDSGKLNSQERLTFASMLRVFSLDVILGAAACGAMAVALTKARPGLQWWFVLPMTVWVIYTLDHILDGRRVKMDAHNIRHLYHYVYRKRLIYALAVVTAITGGIAVLFLDVKVIIFGLVIGSIAGIYLLTNKIFTGRNVPVFQKELWIAAIYTAGIWGGPLTLVNFDVPGVVWIIIGVFFLAALSNLILYSLLEEMQDRKDGFSSAAIRFGAKNVTIFFYIIVILSGITAIGITFMPGTNIQEKTAGFILFIMATVLFIIMYKKDFFIKKGRYRIYGDGIFLLPVLVILVG